MPLTLSWRRPLSYRNQSIDLRSKTLDWVLYDNGLRHERVKTVRVVVPVGPQVEKFTVVNNDDGRTQNCDFSVIDGNILSEQARSKNQKLLVEAEFCYLDYSNMQN